MDRTYLDVGRYAHTKKTRHACSVDTIPRSKSITPRHFSISAFCNHFLPDGYQLGQTQPNQAHSALFYY